jgi:hypothetical protein
MGQGGLPGDDRDPTQTIAAGVAMPTISGTFDLIGGGEEPLSAQADGLRLTHASGSQRFSGGIEGDGSVDWLIAYRADKTARFVGLQRIEGRIGERRGSFVIEASATHDGKASEGAWTIVPGSGSAGLEGISGRGGFDAPGGRTVRYHLDYEIDP